MTTAPRSFGADVDAHGSAIGETRPVAFATRPVLQGTFGMSATTHWLATGTAQAVLERGGNAFDAATAAAFVLHVVEPHLNGPGGDMFALTRGRRRAQCPSGEWP